MILNSYHDGAVLSLGFSSDGVLGTVGVIGAGEFQFESGNREVVTVLAGSLDVQMPSTPWRTVKTGDFYIVPPCSKFSVRAQEEVAYLCEFIQDRDLQP